MSDETFTEAADRTRRTLHIRCLPGAACAMLIAGAGVEEVLEAFGAEPVAIPAARHRRTPQPGPRPQDRRAAFHAAAMRLLAASDEPGLPE